jgi:hypothetical protein
MLLTTNPNVSPFVDLNSGSSRHRPAPLFPLICNMHIRRRRRRRTPGPKNSGSKGPGVNEVSFRARPHHKVHRTLEVDAGATALDVGWTR